MRYPGTFLRDNFWLILIACIIGYVLWRHFHPAPKTGMRQRSKIAQDGHQSKLAVEIVSQSKRVEDIESLRKRLVARLAINSRVLAPRMTGQGLQLAFRLQPSPRACKDGDIDLIEQVAGENGKVLLTVEDDNEVLTSRVLDVKSLKSPLPFSVSIKDAGHPQFFRISLCGENPGKSCRGLQALDFKAYSQQLAGTVKAKPRNGPYVFYAYAFGVDKNEVHLLDGTNLASRQNYANFLQTVNGTRQQLDFIEQTMAQQRKLGILPLNLQDQNVVFPFYFNDKTKCALSMTGR